MRPEFQYLKSELRVNPVTQQKEPYIPFSKRLIRFFGSAVTILFFVYILFYQYNFFLFKKCKKLIKNFLYLVMPCVSVGYWYCCLSNYCY